MASDAERVDKVKQQFRAWDADGNGTISYEELKFAMSQIMPSKNESDIVLMMKEVNTNGDGQINLDEFISWMTDPASSKMMDDHGRIRDFDFRGLLKPLFDVFDKDKGGTISQDEFEECAGLLVNSVKMHPQASESDKWRPSSFRLIDTNGDGEIDFEEFCAWQQKVLKDCGIPKSALPVVVNGISQALQEIMEIDDAVQKGMDQTLANGRLQASINKVAEHARKVYVTSDKDDKVTELGSYWLNPPTGFSLQLLARKCASELGVRLGGLSARPQSASRLSLRRSSTGASSFGHIEICFPDVTVVGRSHKQCSRWFARVSRVAQDGQLEVFKYCFDNRRGKLDWNSVEDSSQFDIALNALTVQMRCLALLKTSGLMSESLSWGGIKNALNAAVMMGLMSQEAVEQYEQQMLKVMLQMMKEHDEIADLEDDEAAHDAAMEHLEDLRMSPLQALVGLMEMGHIPPSSWVKEQYNAELNRDAVRGG
eukprot:TRINITY_DN67751_c0_g1_i1.p1 TRINITY_DN67751_c0_g1~~TRINITY_DN67751_c0_g1_i1.p1  ORF type:complete len:499 (-),score=109.49 TRINITY_DN67751_c0_g1_i1:278-1726(-)